MRKFLIWLNYRVGAYRVYAVFDTIGIILGLIAVAAGIWIVLNPSFKPMLRSLGFLGSVFSAINTWQIWRRLDRGAIGFGVSKDRTIKRNVDNHE